MLQNEDRLLKLVNDIASEDRFFGDLAFESFGSAQDKRYMGAIAILCILIEQAVKNVFGTGEGNYNKFLDLARKNKIITIEEYDSLALLKNLRNKLFHESHYFEGFFMNGMFYDLSEQETKEIIYNFFAEFVFSMILRLRNSRISDFF